MPVPLNRIAPGLLDYFGIKSGEWGPRELGQVLQPVLELRDWYTHPFALRLSATLPAAGIVAASTAAGTFALVSTTPTDFVVAGNILVPQDETWLIVEAQVGWLFQAAAGQTADVWWAFGGITMPSLLSGVLVSDAAIGRSGNRTLDRPFWAQPGDTISVAHSGFVVPAGSVTVFGARLRLVRFKI